MKNKTLLIITIFACVLTTQISAAAQVAQGGNYTLDQAVIAAGGGDASGSNFGLTGTFGQSIAGSDSSGGAFSLKSGFWTTAPVAPTAASATIEGRILTADGQGIRNVSITIADSNGMIRSVYSGSFGYFKIENLPSGNLYTITVQAKKFQFEQSSQVVVLFDDISDLNFIALPN